jgi:hypothetical protein
MCGRYIAKDQRALERELPGRNSPNSNEEKLIEPVEIA